jgi:hypothetical protein
MNYAQVVLFSFSILIAGIIGLIRFKKIDPVYYPFMFCTWIAGINEILSYALVRMGLANTVNNNIYALLEALLIIWQFKRWEFLDRYNKLYSFVIGLTMIVWVLENIGISSIYQVDFFFRVFDAFVIVLMSIHMVSWLIVNGRGGLLKNSMFLICVGYMFFFTFKILTEVFWLYGVRVSNDFSIHVYIIFTWINLFVNLLFAIAILCIPPRPRYISFY